MKNPQQKIRLLMEMGAGSLVENTVNKLIIIQIARYQAFAEQMRPELRTFEEKFRMSSEECYHRFDAGELGDAGDYFEWVGLYENLLLCQERISMLRASLQ